MRLITLKYNATANQYIIKISYGLNLDNFSIYDYNYIQYYNSVDEFIHKNKDDLLYTIARTFPNTIAEHIKAVFNNKLKSLQNLNNSCEPITVTNVTLKFDTLSYFKFDIQLSDSVSNNQIKQLMTKVKPELSSVTLPVKYFEDTVNLDYYYRTYYSVVR